MEMIFEHPVEVPTKVLPTSSLAVANWFIARRRRDSAHADTPLTHTKLQKMTYFAQAIYLTSHNAVLVNEPLEAWQYGPVFHKLFSALRGKNERAGDKFITELAPVIVTEEISRFSRHIPKLIVKGGAQEVLEMVFVTMIGFTPGQLVSITHAKDQPWHRLVTEKFGVERPESGDEIRKKVPRHAEIPHALIKECFAQILAPKATTSADA